MQSRPLLTHAQHHPPPSAALAPAAAVAGSKAAGAGSKAGVGLLFHHSWSSYFHIAEAAMGVFAAAHVLQLDLRTVSLYMTGSKGAEIIGRLLGRFRCDAWVDRGSAAKLHRRGDCYLGSPAPGGIAGALFHRSVSPQVRDDCSTPTSASGRRRARSSRCTRTRRPMTRVP